MPEKKIEQSVIKKLDNIYVKIQFAADEGLSYITIDILNDANKILANNIEFVIKALEVDGYKVTPSKGDDQREGNSWNNLNIYW